MKNETTSKHGLFLPSLPGLNRSRKQHLTSKATNSRDVHHYTGVSQIADNYTDRIRFCISLGSRACLLTQIGWTCWRDYPIHPFRCCVCCLFWFQNFACLNITTFPVWLVVLSLGWRISVLMLQPGVYNVISLDFLSSLNEAIVLTHDGYSLICFFNYW